MIMTERDESILTSLTHKVKALSVGQIHRAWWLDGDVATARARLNILCDADWLVSIRVAAKAIEYFPYRPLAQIESGGPPPEWGELLVKTKSRWNAPIRMVPAVVASTRSARFFGGQARCPRPSEATHDLFLAGVFLRRREECSADADAWVGESQLSVEARGREGVIPDALIRRDDYSTAIEVVGESYSESKLNSFHEFCTKQGWGYELW
jgi:hypothetical protein